MQTEPISKITNEKKDKALKGIQDIWTLFDNCDHNNQFRSNRKSGPWFLSTKF